jgi:putative aminopeptidase FrvX
MWNYEQLFNNIGELVMYHSPSGVETEINEFLFLRFTGLGVQV